MFVLRRTRGVTTNLGGALETGGDNLADDVHEVLGLLDDIVDLDEGGRFADRVVLDGELQPLDECRHAIQVLKQFLLGRPARHLQPSSDTVHEEGMLHVRALLVHTHAAISLCPAFLHQTHTYYTKNTSGPFR